MKRVLSGIQPTGKLHLGNYAGALKNWVSLQDQYECHFFIADLHALTTKFGKSNTLADIVLDQYMDLLSCGIDPERSLVFIQSEVPAHTQLHLILSMLTPLGWLERNPTFKEKKEEIRNLDINNYGFLGYPVLQAADILIYKADLVPVGQDQIPHLEITREIARKFNSVFGNYFPEPQPLLTRIPKVLGTDGRKMSKSYDNAIYLSDPEDLVIKKFRQFITDPAKIRKNDPGNPEVCSLFPYYRFFAAADLQKETENGCRSGSRGCVECKKVIAEIISRELQPYKQKKEEMKKNIDFILKTIKHNTEKAIAMADKNIREIYGLVGLKYGK